MSCFTSPSRWTVGLLLYLGLASGAHAAGQPRVIGGTPTADHPAVGQALYSACGATLIGCNTLLTASHCALGDPSLFLRHAYFQHAGLVDIDPEGAVFDIGYDVAVLKLATPVTRIRPIPINRKTGVTSGPGKVVAWGCDPVFDEGEHIKRSAAVTVSDYFSFGVSASAGGCDGDSGGAILTDVGAGTVIAGTIEGTLGAGVKGPSSYYHRSWIEAAGGADLDNVACGSGAQAGDPNSSTFAFHGSLSEAAPQQTHTFPVSAGTTELRVALNEEDNFRAFVRYGAPPTPTTYDCRINLNQTLALSCTIPAPAAGTYYILVDRISGAGQYQITASTYSDCTDPINDGIACNDGNPCTDSDVCLALACTGSVLPDATVCEANEDDQCVSGALCQAGVCTPTPRPEGTSCTPAATDQAMCVAAGECRAGDCEPVSKEDGTACIPTGDWRPLGSCWDGVCESACPYEQRTDCKAAAKTSLAFSRKGDASSKAIRWMWSKGEAIDADELGDPVTQTQYGLCFYVAGELTTLAFTMPPGDVWRGASGTPPRSFKYKDKSGARDGVTQLQVKSGAAGKTKVKMSGKGTSVPNFTLPLAAGYFPLTVQLVTDDPDGACWTVEYAGEPDRNDEKSFKIRTP